MTNLLSICFILFAFPYYSAFAQQPPVPAEPENPLAEEKARQATGVKLRGLNKVTARSSVLEGKLTEPLEFGNLTITATACWIAPQAERPEQAALLSITEAKPDTASETLVFSGWVFASSPGLSALEHPVYDVTLLECVE